MAKDLRLAIAAANESNIKLPSATLTTQVFDKLANHEDFANCDFSVVLKWLQEANAGLSSDGKAPPRPPPEETTQGA